MKDDELQAYFDKQVENLLIKDLLEQRRKDYIFIPTEFLMYILESVLTEAEKDEHYVFFYILREFYSVNEGKRYLSKETRPLTIEMIAGNAGVRKTEAKRIIESLINRKILFKLSGLKETESGYAINEKFDEWEAESEYK